METTKLKEGGKTKYTGGSFFNSKDGESAIPGEGGFSLAKECARNKHSHIVNL